MNFRIPLSSSIITFRSELSDLKIRDDKRSGSVCEGERCQPERLWPPSQPRPYSLVPIGHSAVTWFDLTAACGLELARLHESS
jgi:hypothetical protein